MLLIVGVESDENKVTEEEEKIVEDKGNQDIEI